MRKIIDLTSKMFGEWLVIGRDTTKQSGKVNWISQCLCGTIKSVQGCNLRSGKSNNCGHSRGVIHGLSSSRLYGIWRDVKKRCCNANNADFFIYMGRGIKMDEEWKGSFEIFQQWAVLNGYENHLTIDRIQNDGNYCPNNCRWATVKEQNNNKRNNIRVEVNGVTQTLSQWSSETGIPFHNLRARFKAGDKGKYLFRPVKRKKVL